MAIKNANHLPLHWSAHYVPFNVQFYWWLMWWMRIQLSWEC